MTGTSFYIGDWLVDPDLNTVARAKHREQIEPQLMRLLEVLAENPGRPVSRNRILEEVWAGLSVGDESLSQAVSKLRRILKDDPENPVYIETIRKKGYRLSAEVRAASPQDGQNRQRFLVLLGMTLFLTVAVVIWSKLEISPGGNQNVSLLTAIPITGQLGREQDPAISPNRQYVVYSKEMNDSNSQLFLHGLGSGTQDRQLTVRGDNGSAAFLPDNNTIVFLRHNTGLCSIIQMTLVDAAERVVGGCEGNSFMDLTVSPDGRWLAFGGRDSPTSPHAIILFDHETGRQRKVTAPPENIWGDYDPHFMDDGKTLVFARSISEGMQDIYHLNISTGQVARLTHEGRNIMGLSHLNEQVIFASNRAGSYSIWQIGTDGKQLTRLPIADDRLFNPSISPDGQSLVAEQIEQIVSLEKITMSANSRSERLITHIGTLLHPNISSASGRITFSSNSLGFYEIWDSDSTGGDKRRLTNFASGFTAHPKFSPDGQFIAFDARPEGLSRIYLMNNDGGNLRVVSALGLNAYAPSWSEDGSTLFFSQESEHGLSLFACEIERNPCRELDLHDVYYARVSSGEDAYFIRPNHDGLWRAQLDGTDDPELIIPQIGFADWGNWILSDKQIIYLDRTTSTLMSYDIETAEARTIKQVDLTLPGVDPALAISKGLDFFLLVNRVALESNLKIVDLRGTPTVVSD